MDAETLQLKKEALNRLSRLAHCASTDYSGLYTPELAYILNLRAVAMSTSTEDSNVSCVISMELGK